MATTKNKINLFESEEGLQIQQDLLSMVSDTAYSTNASYSANSASYPDSLIPFVDKHMNYLKTHPSVDPQHYLANLRLMTRIR